LDSPRDVVWADSAKQALRAIHDYIAQNSPEFAKRVVDKISSRTEQIATFPLSGRIVPEFNVGQLRELFERPYRIIYHIRPNRIEVIALVHMSRHLDPGGLSKTN
jgi:addiction module RelE/StbE family toxin